MRAGLLLILWSVFPHPLCAGISHTPSGEFGIDVQLFAWNGLAVPTPAMAMSQEGYLCYSAHATEPPTTVPYMSIGEFRQSLGAHYNVGAFVGHGNHASGAAVAIYEDTPAGLAAAIGDYTSALATYPGCLDLIDADGYVCILVKWQAISSWFQMAPRAFFQFEACHADGIAGIAGCQVFATSIGAKSLGEVQADVTWIWGSLKGDRGRTNRCLDECLDDASSNLRVVEVETYGRLLVLRPSVREIDAAAWEQVPAGGKWYTVSFDAHVQRAGMAASPRFVGKDNPSQPTLMVTGLDWPYDFQMSIYVEKLGTTEGGSYLILDPQDFYSVDYAYHYLVEWSWPLCHGDLPAAEVAIAGIDGGDFSFGIISAEPETRYFEVQTRTTPAASAALVCSLPPFSGAETVAVGSGVQARLVQVVTDGLGEDREILYEWIGPTARPRFFDSQRPTRDELARRVERQLVDLPNPLERASSFRAAMAIFAPLSGGMNWQSGVDYLASFLAGCEIEVTLVDLNQWASLANDDAYAAMKGRQEELYDQGIAAFCFIGDSSDTERFDAGNPLHADWWPQEWAALYENLTESWGVTVQPEHAILPLLYFRDPAIQGENMCWSAPYGPDFRDLFDVTGDGMPDDVWCRIIPASDEYELLSFLDKFIGVMARPDNDEEPLRIGTFIGDEQFDDPGDHLKAAAAMARAHLALDAHYAVQVRESEYWGVDAVYACLDMLSMDLAILDGWSPFSSAVEPWGGFSKWLGFRQDWLPQAHPVTFMGVVCNTGQTWWPEYPQVGSPVLEDLLFFYSWGGAYQAIAPATGVYLDGATEFAVNVYEGIDADDDQALDAYFHAALVAMSQDPAYPSWEKVARSMMIFGVPGAPIVNPDAEVGTSGAGGESEFSFALFRPALSPFSTSTSVRFAVPSPGRVSLKVFGVDGRLVRTLLEDDLQAGAQELVWDGRDDRGLRAASGVYLARLAWKDREASQKLVLLR